MWTLLAHISGPCGGVVAVIMALGSSLGWPILRFYPYLWRYLEFRMRAQHGLIPEEERRACTVKHRQPRGTVRDRDSLPRPAGVMADRGGLAFQGPSDRGRPDPTARWPP